MNPPELLTLQIDGQTVSVAHGTSVAAALRIADLANTAKGAPMGTSRGTSMGIARRSVTGEARAPFCGMGICQECRVTIDGLRRLACQTHCKPGMVVEMMP